MSMMLVPLIGLKFLKELAAGVLGTSNRQHWSGRVARVEECGVRQRPAERPVRDPRPPGDTPGKRSHSRRSNGETVMDAVVTNFPKTNPLEKGALDHARVTPDTVAGLRVMRRKPP